MSKKIDKGVGITDQSIVIVLIILALALVFGLGTYIYKSMNNSSGVINVNALISSTRSMLKTSQGYNFSSSAEMTGDLVAVGGVPSTLTVSGDPTSGSATITNSWGGNVTLSPIAVNNVQNAGFSVTLTNVPQSSCVSLASKSFSSIDALEINGTTVSLTSGISAITKACTDKSTVTFEIYS